MKDIWKATKRFFRVVFRYLRILLRSCFRVLTALFKGALVVFVLALLVGVVVGAVKIYPMYAQYKADVDGLVENSTPADFRPQESSYIYDVLGNVVAKLSKDADSVYLLYDEIPKNAVNAFVAIEDRTFWDNKGIDMKGIFRVAINYFRTEGEEIHGASTITQQLARNKFLTREVSIERKAKEILIALDLTEKYTKEQIMEFYVNNISYANTYYGLEAAAKGYFGKDADELTLSQTAYLCSIPNSPTFYNPYRHPENALKRRDKILNDMLELELITQSQYEEAIAEEIVIEKADYGFHNYETTYAVDCAVKYLMRLNGFNFQYSFQNYDAYNNYTRDYEEAYSLARDELYTGGYRIYTSLDPVKQDILQSAIDSVLTFDEDVAENGIYKLQGAATAIDNQSGKVVAIVGGRSQAADTYNLNRAFQSYRQPGSSIKPIIIYTPALEVGYTPSTTVKNINVDEAKKKEVNLVNLSGQEMTLREGVERSKNGVAWSVYANVGPKFGISHLTKMQFENIVPDDYYMAASLGGLTYGVTTEEMAGAYSTLANGGVFKEPTCIVQLLDKNGDDIFSESQTAKIYDRNSAYTMIDILKGVIRRGTASSMGWKSDIEAAGKTGTTNNSKDGWFCGVTPYYAISVWVGYDKPRTLSNLYGATYPASIWKQSMEQFVTGLSPASFEKPEENVSAENGMQYLPGRSDDELLSTDYTVGDFRADRNAIDQARALMKQMRSSGSSKKSQLGEQAQALINSISDEVLRTQMLNEMDYHPVYQPETPPEQAPSEEAPSTEPTEPETEKPDTALGPGALIPAGPQEEPVGPGTTHSPGGPAVVVPVEPAPE